MVRNYRVPEFWLDAYAFQVPCSVFLFWIYFFYPTISLKKNGSEFHYFSQFAINPTHRQSRHSHPDQRLLYTDHNNQYNIDKRKFEIYNNLDEDITKKNQVLCPQTKNHLDYKNKMNRINVKQMKTYHQLSCLVHNICFGLCKTASRRKREIERTKQLSMKDLLQM